MTLSADASLAYLQTLCAMPDVDPATGAVDTNGTASKASIIAIAQGAGLSAGDFVEGDPAERFLEYAGRAMAAWGTVPTQAMRAFFFALCTDPGDVDDFGAPDLSADQTPRPGVLSAFGAGWWGTERGGQTIATSTLVIQNAGDSATLPIPVGALIFEASTIVRSDGGSPTYVSTYSAAFAGIGNTLPPLGPNATAVITVMAQQVGSYASAGTNKIDHCVTTTYGTIAVLSSTAAIAQDREQRGNFIRRCQLAADSNAAGGPENAYKRACNTAIDGAVSSSGQPGGILLNYLTGEPVSILGCQVVRSATRRVTGYVYGASGPVSAEDLSSANWNITGVPATLGLLTGKPAGVLPDGVTIGPIVTDPGTNSPGFANAIALTINVAFTAKIAASKVPGGMALGTYSYPGTGGIAAVFTAASDNLGVWLPSLGPGANDQDATGNGSIDTPDIQDEIAGSFPGLRNVVVTTPGGSSTAVAVGHVAVLGSLTGSTIAVVAG